jgi:hypothetical protein
LNIDRSAAALLIALPIAFNTFFFLLGRLFQRLRGVGGGKCRRSTRPCDRAAGAGAAAATAIDADLVEEDIANAVEAAA